MMHINQKNKVVAIILFILSIWPITITMILTILFSMIILLFGSYKMPSIEEAIEISAKEVSNDVFKMCGIEPIINIISYDIIEKDRNNTRYRYYNITQEVVLGNNISYDVVTQVFSYLVIGPYKMPSVDIMSSTMQCGS